MAASLKDIASKLLRHSMAALGCILCFGSAAAEQLSDPTRPPFELVPGLAGGGAAKDAGETARTPTQGLQSVIISPQREAAIINGIEVEVGAKYGDAVLIVVAETCVVLMGPQGRQVLHMFPSVSMTKNELACVKRQDVQPLLKAASRPAIKGKTTKKAKAKKRVVNCVADENKDGSKK